MKRYLPIGTVVLLKSSKKRIMIIGLRQQEAETGKEWDYSACLYPEGIIDPDKLFLFNNDQIERLYHIGPQDSEALEFLARIGQIDEETDPNTEVQE